ncbi:MAG: bifunctional DNA primase/polymerase [Methylocella sp.]
MKRQLPETPLLDAALRYAARGWRVFPARPNRVGLVHWSTEATDDFMTIRRWWAKWPRALVCIACGPSGLAVIDLDVKDGRNGPAVFQALERAHAKAPRTLMQTTSTGGIHLIYRGAIKTTVGVLGRDLVPAGGESGIDTRGIGGMIVAAPSIGKNGKPYLMHDDAELGDVVEPAELPQWIAELAGAMTSPAAIGDGEFDALYSAEEFERLLNLIPVEFYDDKHDAWLELMLACSHSSTVDDGKGAFMQWTLKDGPGNRIGFGSDEALIDARWEYNFARRNMKAGRQVGSFNRIVLQHAPGAPVKIAATTAAEDFADDPQELTPGMIEAQRQYDRTHKKRRLAFVRDTTVQPIVKPGMAKPTMTIEEMLERVRKES